MLSKTLQDGLSDYEIGAKTRALRLKKQIGLVDLGNHTGLSPALLSKIERDRLFPTRPTLLRIALVFGVGLEYFFAGAREKPLVVVTRKSQRVELPERPGKGETAYRFASLDYPATERRFNSYHAEFLPVAAEKLQPHGHVGIEFIYVMHGTLSVHINGEEHALAPDSPHRRRSRGPPPHQPVRDLHDARAAPVEDRLGRCWPLRPCFGSWQGQFWRRCLDPIAAFRSGDA
ncbi:MAG TPA: helix-turn-helix domain-containing protein [Vicinamibacterales bacterium]|nr:helix-turn-helix domain-containing protein [Vicinamibacterales bacterium]